MENFNYYTPTKVVFGKETEQQTGQLVRECGCRKVLVHYGSGSVKKVVCWIGSAGLWMRRGWIM